MKQISAKSTVGELQVPDDIWNLAHFQSWLQAQKAAGNRLDGFKPVMKFWVANGKFLLFWAAHVDIYVAAEERNKSNEIVISRPDIKHVVCVHLPDKYDDGTCVRGGAPEVVLVREFRSTASTESGFIVENPGGSSFKEATARETACQELLEETGIQIDPERLVPIGSRQLAGTTTAHKAHAFAVALSKEELNAANDKAGQQFGEEGSSEQTWVEVLPVKVLLQEEITDWSTLGMIYAAIHALSEKQ